MTAFRRAANPVPAEVVRLLDRVVAVPASIDARLVAPGSSRRLALVRGGLAAVIALRIATRSWGRVARQPAALFDPPGLIAWLPHMPGFGVIWALRVIGTVAALLVVGRRAPRVSFGVAWASLFVLAGLWSSAGKVLHNDVLLLLTCLPVLLAPADAGYRDRSESRRWGWPPRAALAVIALVYFLTGFQKLHHSGLAWVTSDNMRWVLYQGAMGTRAPYPAFTRDLAGQPWLTHVLAGGAMLTELSAPLLLWFRPTRRVFLVLAACLHGFIWLTLGLDYWGWILTVAAVTLPAAVVRSAPEPVLARAGPAA